MEAEKMTDQDLIKLGKLGIEKIKAMQQNPKMEKFADSPCEMFKMEIDGRVATKGQIKINYSVEQVFKFLSNEQSLKILNPQLKEIKVLHQLKQTGDKIQQPNVIYMQYNGIWPVANRDFVCISYTIKENNNIYISTQSCAYPEPEKKGVVRGKISIGGYVLKKVDDNTTMAVYLSDADLCGSIPGMVKNQLSKKQGSIVSRIQESMKKNKI